ncbi:uncharacterized protein LOC143018399 [Oratosquilla oratoria]|uniref:uncharacterized protein LOC143018399 n=1 Tax=Oratosquilla oratoria TaxID=337810 RepID=UPI003F768D32
MVVERNGRKIRRWQSVREPPYFKKVEADIRIVEKRSSSMLGVFAAKMGIIPAIRDIMRNCMLVRTQAKKAVYDTPVSTKTLWPVGLDGRVAKISTCLDPAVIGQTSVVACKTDRCIVRIEEMVDAFELDQHARDRVLSGESSLLAEVNAVCSRWEFKRGNLQVPTSVPAKCIQRTRVIHPEEQYYKCKFGVYFMPKRKSVIKFLTSKMHYPGFVWETAFGLSVERIKGVVSVHSVCPEAFCVEMDFTGIGLDFVINGSAILENQSYSLACLYAVRMLAACGWVKDDKIVDTYHASLVTNRLREKLLINLPFVMAEMANIITRLSQQGIVNPDIKCDNFVLDPATGQPFMIDLGLAIPEGCKDDTRRRGDADNEQYPHSPPEFLCGRECTASAMIFGLAYTFKDMLLTLIRTTNDPGVAAIHNNLHFLNWIRSAYSNIPGERPAAAAAATIIGSCFPFNKRVAGLFSSPKHVVYTGKNKNYV